MMYKCLSIVLDGSVIVFFVVGFITLLFPIHSRSWGMYDFWCFWRVLLLLLCFRTARSTINWPSLWIFWMKVELQGSGYCGCWALGFMKLAKKSRNPPPWLGCGWGYWKSGSPNPKNMSNIILIMIVGS